MIRPLRILTVDMGIANIGLAVTHDQVGQPRLACRTITPAATPVSRRPTVMDHQRAAQTIDAIIAAAKCRPDLVLIETPISVGGKGDTDIRLAEIHGAVKHWCWAKRIPYRDVHLTKPKIYATDNGGAKKPDVLAAVIARYGQLLHVGSYDEADAVAMLFMGLDHYGSQVTNTRGELVDVPAVPQRHRRALAGIEWPKLDDLLGGDR